MFLGADNKNVSVYVDSAVMPFNPVDCEIDVVIVIVSFFLNSVGTITCAVGPFLHCVRIESGEIFTNSVHSSVKSLRRLIEKICDISV